jgi:hypothetical protein
MITRTVLFQLAAAAISTATLAQDGVGRLSRTTDKSLPEFAMCFAAAQEAEGRPWWFVPDESGGGTFSNFGSDASTSPYFLEFTDKQPQSKVDVYWTSSDQQSRAGVTSAIDKCV